MGDCELSDDWDSKISVRYDGLDHAISAHASTRADTVVGDGLQIIWSTNSTIMDSTSIIMEPREKAPATTPDINARITGRVRALRAARGLSLEALAEASGVSRSMISLIERAETSATATVLEKLAAGLNTTLASLFEEPERSSPVSRRGEQPTWRDPGSGYVRRNVSPSGRVTPIQIVEVEFPPGARVAYDAPPRNTVVHHQVWVLSGSIEVTVGTEVHVLYKGDCLAFTLDQPTAYHNPTRSAARYAVVMVAGTGPRRGP